MSGDSLAFSYKDGELQRVSSDDSVVYDKFFRHELPGARTIDDLKFYIKSNQIKKCIGIPGVDCSLSANYVDRDTTLVLTTDGVSDCILMDKIKDTVQRGDKQTIAKRLVDEAVRKGIFGKLGKPFHLWLYEEFSGVQKAKDNSTVAVVLGKDMQDQDNSERY